MTAPPNYDIELCRLGEDPLPETARGRFDACILRFVLQHVSDPGRVLRAVYDALPAGGRIYVIEEDLSFTTVQPDWEPFRLAADGWMRVTQAGGSDSMIGCKLPALAKGAGFVVDDLEILLRNNVEMGPDLGDFLASALVMFQRTSPHLIGDDEVSTVVEGFEASREDHAVRAVATYPQVLMMATKES